MEPINRGAQSSGALYKTNADGVPPQLSSGGLRKTTFIDTQYDEELTELYDSHGASNPYTDRRGVAKGEACLMLVEHAGVETDSYGNMRSHWFRKLPGWDEGRNWVTTDELDMGPALGDLVKTHHLLHLKPGSAEGSRGVPGGEIVSYSITDRAIVLKTSMTRGPTVCSPANGKRCVRGPHGIVLGYRPLFDVAIPLLSNHAPVRHALPREWTFAKRTLLAFFKGGNSQNVRHALVDAHDPSRHFITMGTKGSYVGRGGKRLRGAYDYVTSMLSTKFGFAPPGAGLHSYRLNEVMQYGAVAVLVTLHADEYVPPFADTVDWAKFSFSFTVKDVPRLADVLERVSEAKWSAMQRRSLLVHRYCLSPRRALPASFEIIRRRIAVAIAATNVCSSRTRGGAAKAGSAAAAAAAAAAATPRLLKQHGDVDVLAQQRRKARNDAAN